MEKKDVISFFDSCAADWDAEMIRHDGVITKILDNGGIRPGVRVLDVACGTGVLFPDYLAREAKVTGIDISPEMARIAREKFPQIPVYCGDVETALLPGPFDVIMVYNAFPHFPEPEKLIERLSGLLPVGGRLSVAHGMSRAQIQKCHEGSASRVSIGLLEEGELAKLFERWFHVDTVISDAEMYQVSGTKR